MEFHLYKSECVADRSRSYDLRIVRAALRNNAKHGVTGFLHRNRTHYFQYIEGPEAALEQLLANIKADHRHVGFQTLLSAQISQRRFPGWSMGHSDGLSQESRLDDVQAGDHAETVLAFLMDTAEQQRIQLNSIESRAG